MAIKKAKDVQKSKEVRKARPKSFIDVCSNPRIVDRVKEDSDICSDLSKEKLSQVLKSLLRAIKTETAEKGNCAFRGFGIFKKVEIPASKRYIKMLDYEVESEAFDKLTFKPTSGMKI